MTGTALSLRMLQRYGLPPDQIEQLSLRRLEDAAAQQLPAEEPMRSIVKRVLYAAGDPALAPSVLVHPSFVGSALPALRRGAPVIVDVSMVAAGLRRSALDNLGCHVHVALAVPEPPLTPDNEELSLLAPSDRPWLTRSARGMLQQVDHLGGALVVIGNAPTALLALLDVMDAGLALPAAVVGMPVGLVAAAESKAELEHRSVPFITIRGTRGGSALAAAAVNALLALVDVSDGR